jgi:RNA polymerase sigma factor (sigma-70 family)
MDDFPSPPGPGSGPAEHARYFAALVNAAMHLTLSDEAVARIRGHFSRFWPDALDDFVSCAILECLQSWKTSEPFTEREVLLAVDRVRHRLMREAKRFRDGEIAEKAAEQTLPPEEELKVVLSEFREFLATCDTRDAFLFQRHYLDGASPQALAEETGIPLSTIYRRLKAIRDEFNTQRATQTRPPKPAG